MKVNYSLMSVRKLPGNVYEHLEFVRKQQKAAPIVFWCMAGVAIIILAVMFQSCVMTGDVR